MSAIDRRTKTNGNAPGRAADGPTAATTGRSTEPPSALPVWHWAAWFVRWTPRDYVFGEGAQVLTPDGRRWELIPYVLSGQPGGPHGYGIWRDWERSGCVRVPGPIDQAKVAAELMMMEDAVKGGAR